MKKLISLFGTLLVVGLVLAILYVFDIPPFKSNSNNTSNNTQQISQILPDFLSEEKISRNKTYDDYIKRGALLEKNGFYNLAIAEYQGANKLDPNNVEPFIQIGRLQLIVKNFEQAEMNFIEAVKLKPDSIDAQIYLGRAMLQNRKFTEAKQLFDKITTPTQSVLYYQGLIAAFTHDDGRAKDLLNRAKAGDNQEITKKAQNILGAYQEYESNQGGEKIHLYTLISRSLSQIGEYQMAIVLLFDIIKTKADYRDAWIILGYSYLNLERYNDAIEALEKAKNIDPQKADTFFYLGLTYYGMNQYDKAIQMLEQAQKLGYEPKIQISQKLAEIYTQIKQYDKAAEKYEQVVSLNSSDINYYVRPIWIYLEKINQPQRGLALAQRAFDQHPENAMAYNLLGWAQIYNNQLDQAFDNLQAAESMNPQLDAVYLNFGKWYEKEGDAQSALSYYSKAHQLGQGNGISNSAAENYNLLAAKIKNSANDSIKADISSN